MPQNEQVHYQLPSLLKYMSIVDMTLKYWIKWQYSPYSHVLFLKTTYSYPETNTNYNTL